MAFIAIDGEGLAIDGVHTYVLLAASDGSYIRHDKGLRSVDCLAYLFDLKARNPNTVLVSFYFSYDTNMMLRDVSLQGMKELATNGSVILRRGSEYYRVEYIPRKYTRVTWYRWINRKRTVLSSVQIFDVWGFFQSSFVKALEGYDIEADYVQSMKVRRNVFTLEDMDEIVPYCLKECELLVQLMDKLQFAFDSAGVVIKQYHGAGAIAGFYLKKYGVKPKLCHFEELDEEIRSAYFGGRVQSFKLGEFTNTVYNYDLVSAYPWALSTLPSFAGSVPVRHSGYVEAPYALYKVSWKSVPNVLPVRLESGRIIYPATSGGWYHSCEIVGILDSVEVLESIVFEGYSPNSFGFVLELFEERKRLKAEGNLGQIAVKLGLNSLYGKMAQLVGSHDKRPAYQDLLLAGMITALTRSKMQEIILQYPKSVIMVSTDGIILDSKVPLKLGSSLGDWEEDSYAELRAYKSGIYEFIRDGKSYKTRQRGFSSMDWDKLYKEFREVGLSSIIEFESQRFRGMKSARDKSDWCQWYTDKRKMSLLPSVGLARLIQENPDQYEHIQPGSAPFSCPYTKSHVEQKKPQVWEIFQD